MRHSVVGLINSVGATTPVGGRALRYVGALLPDLARSPGWRPRLMPPSISIAFAPFSLLANLAAAPLVSLIVMPFGLLGVFAAAIRLGRTGMVGHGAWALTA